ncbi:translation elongation factor Ts [Desulfosudis oleivorans]|uniref:Elongation factor Ts n=1 Tax=Desulfosudis oleivorans (strain DSM 6200 / JCM 39069 / Hxd3) TaxID=96561 RepID=EFTS_DESOH|nr:translation elongation factor Ts [Desulfosudis oleivorans]A8ZTM1.1 RecName: Full=Elongation factor Ts; Short=EF-Ts [Desulfosudis oleivorans Hxd3]ABW66285.1 translation elongation factor Ts [Desulfosudis oleivorans Hxd3]
MGTISASLVKELREKTGAGMMDCKEALTACDGDIEKAVDFLRQKGLAKAAKRSGRETSEGIVESYIHMGGKIGVMVEVNCESDFVAKTDDFKEFARNVAMQIAATNPAGIAPEDVPADLLERERQVYRAQVLEMGKPENMVDKIVDGKIKKFFKESCLIEQQYVKNPDITIGDYLNETVAKIGESIRIKRFARFALGE